MFLEGCQSRRSLTGGGAKLRLRELEKKGTIQSVESGEQIIQYLAELAEALADLHVMVPFHILITGGAYMLLRNKRRSTLDIDFALLEDPQPGILPGQACPLQVKKAEISGKTTTVPWAAEFKQAVQFVAGRHGNLPPDWLNDEAAIYYYDDAPQAEGTFWRAFGATLCVYLPTMEYILATKLAAYRPKDATDIRLLLQDLQISARAQVEAIVTKFLLPDAREFWEIDEKVALLFP